MSQTVVISGTSVDVIVQGGIATPGGTGPSGPQGNPGAAATVSVGSTTTGLPGTSAAVSNAGTTADAVLNFTIPRGDVGAQGTPGTNGTNGAPGAAATIAVGTVTTGAPGSSAVITNAGTSSAAVFNFTIPRGDPGAGTGDVVGPASSVVDQFAVFSNTTGKLLKAVTPTKSLVGLGNVDNTSDANKPVSTATQTALDLKASISDVLNTQTGTTYTLQASDNGKVVEFSNAAAITLTIPVLTAGFNCLIRQVAAGVPSWTASGTTLRNRQSHTKLAGQWAEASISYRTTTEVVISGDTAA